MLDLSSTRRAARRALHVASAGAVLLSAACGSDSSTAPPDPTVTNNLSATAATYLKNALDFMQQVFVNRKAIDWTKVRGDATAQVKGAQTTRDTYPGIRYALSQLNDRHVGFWEPERAPGRVDSPSSTPQDQLLYRSSGRPIQSKLAYLYVPTFTGKNPVGRADSILTVIRELDQSAPCGWVLDLRNNPGGYWAAMIAGINPLLGNGRFAGFVDGDSSRAFFYSYGPSAGVVQDSPRDSVEYLRASSSYQLRRPGSPVAILQGSQTASAGEIIVLGFKGPNKPAVRTFGAPTYGVTTVPSGIYLRPDSAFLNVTAAIMFDGNRKIYGDAIPVDQAVAGPTTSNPSAPASGVEDPVVQAAQAWLLARPECQNAPDLPFLANRIPTTTRPGFARQAPAADELQPGQRIPVSPVFGGKRALR